MHFQKEVNDMCIHMCTCIYTVSIIPALADTGGMEQTYFLPVNILWL